MKKLLLGLGAVSVAILPMAAMLSCSGSTAKDITDGVFNSEGFYESDVDLNKMIFGKEIGTLAELNNFVTPTTAQNAKDRAAVVALSNLTTVDVDLNEIKQLAFFSNEYGGIPSKSTAIEYWVTNSINSKLEANPAFKGYKYNNGRIINTEFNYIVDRAFIPDTSSMLSAKTKAALADVKNYKYGIDMSKASKEKQKEAIISNARYMSNIRLNSVPNEYSDYDAYKLSTIGLASTKTKNSAQYSYYLTTDMRMYVPQYSYLALTQLEVESIEFESIKFFDLRHQWNALTNSYDKSGNKSPEWTAESNKIAQKEKKLRNNYAISKNKINLTKTDLNITIEIEPGNNFDVSTFNAETDLKTKLNYILIGSLDYPQDDFKSYISNISATQTTTNAPIIFTIEWNYSRFIITRNGVQWYNSTRWLPINLPPTITCTPTVPN